MRLAEAFARVTDAPGSGALEKLLDQVLEAGDCWIYCGGKASSGYGATTYRHRFIYAHHLAYVLLVGPLPEGTTQLRHRCRNRLCVRPDHLVVRVRKEC